MSSVNRRQGISIVIPTKNSYHSLKRLINSLMNQNNSFVEIIVIDSISRDGTAELCNSLGVRIVQVELERSQAKNLGFKLSTYGLVLFLDSDMEVGTDFINECLDGSLIGGAFYLREKVITGQNKWSKSRNLERDNFFKSTYMEAPRLFWREVFEQVGGYDGRFVGNEDLDLNARLIETGNKIGWIEATIYHHEEEVSPINYLRKRVYYSKYDKLFKHDHRWYWEKLISFPFHARLLIRGLRTVGYLRSIELVPLYVFLRGAEFILRYSISMRNKL